MRISDWSSDVCSSDLVCLHIAIVGKAAALAAAGTECGDRNPRRDAGLAAGAMWPVHMIAATAKPAGQRGGIGLRDVGIVRVEQQIAGHALAEIAAAMIAGLEQSDGGAVLQDRKSTRLNSSH